MDIPKEIGGRFVIGAEIVKRAACVVYKATDKSLGGREVALKVFFDRPEGNEDYIKSFDAEINLLRSASHHVLVPIIGGGCENGFFFIAMEYIGGRTLREVFKEKSKPFDVGHAVEIIAEVAGGLNEIHEKGGVHGHIDARSILFKEDEPRLAGFHPSAIDRIQKQSTSVAKVVADPACISPEQISGSDSIDRRADIYALSVLLFNMVTGEKPFQAANPLQAAMLRITQPPPSPLRKNPSLSPLLDAAIQKGLAKEPKDRFRNCTDFIDAITGGKKPYKNPFAEVAQELQVSGNETIAVSMSTEAIKELLKKRDAVPAASAVLAQQTPKVTPVIQPSAMDVNATAMGIPALNTIKPSLVALDEELKGKKFIIDKNQVMVGNDPGCSICLSGRGIPPRFAIIVQRGDEFFAGPLSATPLTINGTQHKSSEEVKLQRGDVLHVGKHRLRYVSPGEVFTLKEGVADRVLDRPRNKFPLLLGALVIVLAIAAGAGVYLRSQEQQAQALKKQRETIRLQQEREKRVKDLTREADELFKSGALREPLGANAEEKFKEILTFVPDNNYAKRRLAEIEERIQFQEKEKERREQFATRITQLLAEGDKYLDEQQYISPPGRNAKEKFTEVLRLDSSNETAQKKIAGIDKLMADLLGKVNTLLAEAKAYADAGQYTAPSDKNAYSVVKHILSLDPNNLEANNLLYDMAAKSIYRGDLAKREAKPEEVRRAYFTAQALGVDPLYIAERMKGLDLISRATSNVIIYGGSTSSKAIPKSSNGSYLDSSEIEKRLANFQLQEELSGKKGYRSFIQIGPR